jgi:uncharacterized protein YdaU (DUF1376 family)
MTADAKPDAWMPLYIGDWDGDTGHLDCEQDGAYGRLIRWYWRNGPLPDDDLALSRIIRMPLARWRKVRPTIAAFFRIADGVWRHKRQDEERERWGEKRRRYIERASAGGRAKAAKSSATSTPKALLKGCTSASTREVEGPTGLSTLSGQNEFLGPKEVRDAFLAKMGEAWCVSYLDPCGWQDVPERALIPATKYAGTKLIRDARAVLAALGLSVLERAA